MEALFAIGAVVLFMALLLGSSSPAPQPPVVVYVPNPDRSASGSGCLGVLFGLLLFVALLVYLSQGAS